MHLENGDLGRRDAVNARRLSQCLRPAFLQLMRASGRKPAMGL